MRIFSKILYIISKLGYKALINTQIKVYDKLEKQHSEASESDLLNLLIISRTSSGSLPKVTFAEESLHYKPILDNPDKTLEDVIWAIANYEYFESKYAQSRSQKHKMPDWYLSGKRLKIQAYIRKAIKKRNNGLRKNG